MVQLLFMIALLGVSLSFRVGMSEGDPGTEAGEHFLLAVLSEKQGLRASTPEDSSVTCSLQHQYLCCVLISFLTLPGIH